MESITENRKMFYTLTTPIVALVAIVLGWFPDFTEWFQLVEFDAEYRVNVIKVRFWPWDKDVDCRLRTVRKY